MSEVSRYTIEIPYKFSTFIREVVAESKKLDRKLYEPYSSDWHLGRSLEPAKNRPICRVCLVGMFIARCLEPEDDWEVIKNRPISLNARDAHRDEVWFNKLLSLETMRADGVLAALGEFYFSKDIPEGLYEEFRHEKDLHPEHWSSWDGWDVAVVPSLEDIAQRLEKFGL